MESLLKAVENWADRKDTLKEVHFFSLKIGGKGGMWQYNIAENHDKIMLHRMRHILNKTCQLLGYDYEIGTRSDLFSISKEPFEGYQLALSKMREEFDGYGGMGCVYNVVESRLSEQFRAEGLLPAFVKDSYLHEWPEKVYIKLEATANHGIIN